MSSPPSQPAPPDYTGAANATAAGNLENIRAQTSANRVDQYTPYGNQTYTQTDPNNPDKWRSDISLAPLAQNTLDSQMQLSQNMGDLGNQAVGRVDQTYQQPFDLNSVQGVADKSYSNYTSRLDPQWAANDQSQAAKLANEGITQGSEAYNNSMRTYNQSKNDAYTQANQAAINTMPQTYQLASSIREQPLNELNAIRTGAQIQNPQFQPGGQQGYTPGPDLLGAAQGQNQYNLGAYNAKVGQSNSFNSGLFGLAGAALPLMF